MDVKPLAALVAILHLTVLAEQRFPMPGAILCLKNERGAQIGVTDENGVSMMEVPAGEYSVKARMDGFVDQEITGIRIIEERELVLDIILPEVEGDVITVTGEPSNDC